MLYSLCLYFFILFASVGYGSLLLRILGVKLAENLNSVFLCVIPGFIVAGLVANGLNFIIPLTATSTYLYLIFGVLVFILEYRKKLEIFSDKKFVFLFGLFSVLFVAYSIDNNTIEDSGLYHIQLIKWMKYDKIVLGLANLHDRFGFNSLWLSICAILTPKIESTHYVDISLTVLFISVLSYFWLEYKKESSRLAIFIVAFILTVWGKDQLFQGLGSPATDTPSALLFIVVAYLLYKNRLQENALVVLFSAFSVLLKLSQIGLIFIALYSIFSLYKANRILLFKIFLFSFILIGVWVGRGVLLSGCVVHPQEMTCMDLPWTAPISETIEAKLWIKSWARQDKVDYAIVLRDNQWIQSWMSKNLSKFRFVLSLILIGVGIVLALRNRKKSQMEWKALVFAVSTLSLIPWFLLAPDVRFASGALIFSSALVLTMINWPTISGRYLKVVKCIVAIFVFIFVLDLGRITKSVLIKHPIVKTFDPADLGSIRSDVSRFGVHYTLPDEKVGSDKCWYADLPCAPFVKPLLQKKTISGYNYFCIKCEDNNVIQ